MHQLISYIKFLFSSTNQHGVHSPFVYDFVTKCLYDKTNYSNYSKITEYRNALLRNNDVIEITDFGSGSRKFKSNKRLTSQIVHISSTPLKRTKLFFRLALYLKPKNSLELGTNLGIVTHAISLGNPEGNITSIEGCPNISIYTKIQLARTNNINISTGEFEKVIPNLKEKSFDLIFFDGHHNKKATIKYFEALLSKSHNDSIFIFDDIYWSKEMTEAWEYIKYHNAVTVTVDCFHLGFVFFRKEQAKEHFKIRL
ncbi:O-methyltransferase [Winogradskyella sp. HB-48]|uniref:O-methyltransferase n=1 Tax=Winogradskyella sp. HB-48 TaxID=3416808 RepID=UPI003CECA6B1